VEGISREKWGVGNERKDQTAVSTLKKSGPSLGRNQNGLWWYEAEKADTGPGGRYLVL